MIVIPAYIAGNILYRLADNGLANFLGLETLRHGTNLVNAISIRIFGGDPKYGGKDTGSTASPMVCAALYDSNLPGRFYVFKDSEWQHRNITPNLPFTTKLKALFWNYPSVGARYHCLLSGRNFCTRIANYVIARNTLLLLPCALLAIFGIFTNIFLTPTLRFRFSEIDPERFKDDPVYHGCAYMTEEKVHAWRIGMSGTLLTGLNTKWFSRIKAKPLKVLTGVVQITTVVVVSKLVIKYLPAQRKIILSLALGALTA